MREGEENKNNFCVPLTEMGKTEKDRTVGRREQASPEFRLEMSSLRFTAGAVTWVCESGTQGRELG